ncbi:SNF2 family N-terminal domain-containing protein [Hypomontagnella monticulosa]|nr:SNF2 family N-terminal domain-containing protein [Hypomontagnella monticulosa]
MTEEWMSSQSNGSWQLAKLDTVQTDEQWSSNGAHLTTICYGMLDDLRVIAMPSATIIESSNSIYALFADNGAVLRRSDGAFIGKLEETAIQVLLKLIEEGVYIQFMIKADYRRISRAQKNGVTALASAILYGPEDFGDDIGEFLDKCKYCLQDPYGCELNVPYKNPHCLSALFEKPSMTSVLSGPEINYTPTFSVAESLRTLETTDTMLEWKQPSALRTELKKHQKQALWFFIVRENRPYMRSIWQPRALPDNSLVFYNEINGSQQDVPPPNWNGGILADEMGLGKTLQMIALIAENKFDSSQYDSQSSLRVAATLIILPMPLMSVWESQLSRHTHKGKLTWRRHHGQSRFGTQTSPYPDIVITTYQTVQSEYKRRNQRPSTLFSYHWHRIILDEAHIIRNETTTASAVCSLSATYRWAVTGTPIQNSLTDLCGLFKFLRIQPYDDNASVDKEIFEFIRREDRHEGIRRLKALCNNVMIRRRSNIIDLPPRKDLIRTVEFTPQERWLYQDVESRMHCDMTGNQWISAIQLINKLRLICNLGVASPSRTLTIQQVASGPVIPERDSFYGAIQASELALGETSCALCDSFINVSDTPDSTCAYSSACGRIFCMSCAALVQNRSIPGCLCPTGSLCTLQHLSSALVRKARDEAGETDTGSACWPISSKVRAVVEDIQNNILEKSVVLSFWTTTLNMVQYALDQAQIRYVRIDGTVTPAKREAAMQDLRDIDAVRVLLITVSCGGVGLDLTAASRVHLLEPQWNPAIEDQALARVHRMGQQRPVVAIRYIMRGSIEESVATTKGKKKLLAELLPLTKQSEDTKSSQPFLLSNTTERIHDCNINNL